MDDSIENYRQDKEIIGQTIEQIKKDFDRHLPDLVLSGNASTIFEELKHQIEPIIKSLHKNNRTVLRVLLYKIDIKEADISSLSYAEMAEKIIQREFQKILTRKFFSS
jgi:hypothetical protein